MIDGATLIHLVGNKQIPVWPMVTFALVVKLDSRNVLDIPLKQIKKSNISHFAKKKLAK